MLVAGQRPDYLAADARVNAAAGTFAFNTGAYRSVLRTGVGVHEITIDPPMDPNEHVTLCQAISAVAGDLTVNLDPVSSVLYRVRGVANNGAGPVATDVDFYMESNRVLTAR